MTDWINILLKAFWCGWAAVGFGILFNVPPKTLFGSWIGGAIAGFIKFTVLFLSASSAIIQSSFFAAVAVGIFSVPIAERRHEPPMIFAIPSIIPLIPGVFAYRTMLGLIKLTGDVREDYSLILSQTVHNGVTTLFIIMSIAIGVAIPIHVIRKDPSKKISVKFSD
jgi:uncharacterized membrane protein YjjB (DUF3815 family)